MQKCKHKFEKLKSSKYITTFYSHEVIDISDMEICRKCKHVIPETKAKYIQSIRKVAKID